MGRAMLLLVSGLLIVAGVIQQSIQNRQSAVAERTLIHHGEQNVQNIAHGLADYAIRELINDPNWNGGYSEEDFIDQEELIRVQSAEINVYDQNDNANGDIPGHLQNSGNWNQWARLIHIQTVTDLHLGGAAGPETRVATTEIWLTNPSFSQYAYFTEDESVFWFISEDVLSGPVHSNDRMKMHGTPTFNGFVSSTQEPLEAGTGPPEFNGGSDFATPEIEFPDFGDLTYLSEEANDGGLQFANEVEITFKADGTADIRENLDGVWGEVDEYTENLADYNGVLSGSQLVHVEGVVSGQYTVHSNDDIRIKSDIVYNEDPREVPESQDLLGLVSEKEVVIENDAHEQNGTHDLSIHASIMALDKSFGVDDIWAPGGPKGDLEVLGGIIQHTRAGVSVFGWGGNLIRGYAKDYSYDDRLQNMHPPHFPRLSSFMVSYWVDELSID